MSIEIPLPIQFDLISHYKMLLLLAAAFNL